MVLHSALGKGLNKATFTRTPSEELANGLRDTQLQVYHLQMGALHALR